MQRLPGVRLAWLVHEITDELIHEAMAAGIQQLCPRANIVTETAVTNALQAGLSVRGWGIKDPEVGLERHLGDCSLAHNSLPKAGKVVAVRLMLPDAQLLLRMKASGAQGCTVNWPDRADTALKQHEGA